MRPSLILASSSNARKLLLEQLKIPFKTISPNVDETPFDQENPRDMVTRLAKEKAYAVATQFPDSLIIGADLVGCLQDTILCKPLSYENAFNQLSLMSGNKIKFLIGLCLLDTRNNTHQLTLEQFEVVFRTLTSDLIESYLQREEVLNCAGSLKIEGLGISLIEKLIGDDYTALIGLPMIRLSSMLEKAEVPPCFW